MPHSDAVGVQVARPSARPPRRSCMHASLAQVNSSDFGVPHHRPRVYFLGFMKSALRAEIAVANVQAVQGLIEMKLQRKRVYPGDFRHFLGKCGFPIGERLVMPGVGFADSACTCASRRLCKLHTCRCAICKRKAPEAMQCIWRRGQSKSVWSTQWKGLTGKPWDLDSDISSGI